MGIAGSILLLIAALTLPPLQVLLSLTPLAMWEVTLLAGLGILNLLTIECVKWLARLSRNSDRKNKKGKR